jgi:arylsulfatase A-like enzyme
MRRKEPGQPNPAIDIVASDQGLPDRLNIDQARAALVSLSSSKTPFFMAVGTHKPHLPFRVPQSAWDATPQKRSISQALQKSPEGAPPWSVVAYEIWNYDDLPEKPGPMTPAQTQRLRRAYAASITYVDTLIGDLLQTLDETGLSDDTLIVLWSDHGYKLGEYGAWSKHTTHEVDLKIPLLMVSPRLIPQSSRSLAIIETVDIYPTVLDLAGIELPSHLEGTSFKDVTLGQTDVAKKAAYSEITRWVSGVKLQGQSVRDDRYRYTAWVSVPSGEIVSRELYDHRTELLPTLNLADNKKLAPVLDSLEALRFKHWHGS